MVGYLLNIAYLLLLVLLAPSFLYARLRYGKYRQGWSAKLLGRVPVRSGDQSCVWLHAVSVGEVQVLTTIIDEIRRQRPDWQCVISTTTQTGYALAQRKFPELAVFYCPLDFTWSTENAMRRIRPDLLVLAELELWPNLIRAARRHRARVAVVNARLSDNSYRGYRRIRPLFARLLRQVDLIAAQNEQYAERFLRLGAAVACVHVTGSVKFDGAVSERHNRKTSTLAALAGFDPQDQIFLAGSTQAPEERLALETFRSLEADHPDLRLVLVPRHPERFDEVARLLDQSGFAWQRRSDLAHPSIEQLEARILLVDTIGELGAWWGTAAIGFVGGSLGSRGGQNMIEPAAYGVALAFGPHTENFRDVVAALLGRTAAVVVEDAESLTTFVGRCLDEPQYATSLGQSGKALVAENRGATAKTVNLLSDILPPNRAAGRRAA